jgi:hypothetical protein
MQGTVIGFEMIVVVDLAYAEFLSFSILATCHTVIFRGLVLVSDPYFVGSRPLSGRLSCFLENINQHRRNSRLHTEENDLILVACSWNAGPCTLHSAQGPEVLDEG